MNKCCGNCILQKEDAKICKRCKNYGVYPDKEVEPNESGEKCWCYKHNWVTPPWESCEDYAK